MNRPTINHAFLDAVVSGSRRSRETVQQLRRLPGSVKRELLGSDQGKARQAALQLFHLYFSGNPK